MNEFELIKQFCSYQTVSRADVIIGPGDDCAILDIPPGQQLAVTTDTLVAGVHFPLITPAYDIGYKSLAVNLSDLAAMGASPAWVTFALTIPSANEDWLDALARGFFDLATRYQVQLIGGDLTQGPLCITLQAQGFIPTGQAITRRGAKVGDLIYVTNTVGDAGLGLLFQQKKKDIVSAHQDEILTRLNRPEPRVQIGEKLRGIASAAIDVSDGLLADLEHITEKSGVGATLNVDQVPLSDALRASLSTEDAIDLALNAGDDYEICFTVPPQKQQALADALKGVAGKVTCIGTITETTTIALQYQDGKTYHGKIKGYQHF